MHARNDKKIYWKQSYLPIPGNEELVHWVGRCGSTHSWGRLWLGTDVITLNEGIKADPPQWSTPFTLYTRVGGLYDRQGKAVRAELAIAKLEMLPSLNSLAWTSWWPARLMIHLMHKWPRPQPAASRNRRCKIEFEPRVGWDLLTPRSVMMGVSISLVEKGCVFRSTFKLISGTECACRLWMCKKAKFTKSGNNERVKFVLWSRHVNVKIFKKKVSSFSNI